MNKNIKYKCLQIWIVAVIVITLIYVLGWCFCNNDISPLDLNYLNSMSQMNSLNSMSNNLPPPLFNFMNPAKSQNFIKVGDVVRY